MRRLILLTGITGLGITGLFAQPTQQFYGGSSVTGQLILARTMPPIGSANISISTATTAPIFANPEIHKNVPVFLHPPVAGPTSAVPKLIPGVSPGLTVLPSFSDRITGRPRSQSIPVASGGTVVGFNGLSHYDQRQAYSGNQFSVEPPNPSIAVANGYILEGVNNGVRIFSTSGTPLTRTLASNELFGVGPAIDRTTGIYGVYTTDMRVFFDQDINRWFVLQRSQDEDTDGNFINSSHLYLAVSQSADPTGGYYIYVMNTTNTGNPGCPCVADYPQIGSDRYGFYISSNEYGAMDLSFVDASIMAISKSALAAGVAMPSAFRFLIPMSTGYEFSIQPATTPPGASPFIGSGGLEYFVSSRANSASDNNLAVWALTNTASLQAPSPSLTLIQITVPTISYFYPDVANQRSGPLPYGSTLLPPGSLEFLDGNPDSRVLSVSYAAARLFATFPSQVLDDNNRSVVGGGYVVLAPAYRNGILTASVVKQGYISVTGNHILRPAVAVNGQGKGVIAFTLVGSDYFPSSAFTTIDAVSAPSVVRIAGAGAGPEDGFTGYPGGVARWGDYATSFASTDGSVWSVSEFIPGTTRTPLANWGTFISKYVP